MIGGHKVKRTSSEIVAPGTGIITTIAYTGDPVIFYVNAVDEDINIYWGDGQATTVTAGNGQATNKAYSANGNYDIEITGRGTISYGSNDITEHDWVDIKQWGTAFVPTSASSMFRGCDNIGTITATDSADFDLSNVTTTQEMFHQCTNFDGDISGFDMSNVTVAYFMFRFSGFNSNINTWNVSNIYSMNGMFAYSSFNQPLNNWNTSSLQNAWDLFRSNTAFNQDISMWNTSTLESANNMFNGATSFDQNLSGWDVSAVTTYIDYDNGATAWEDWKKPFYTAGLVMTVDFTGDAVSFYAAASGQDIVVDWGDGNTTTITDGTTNTAVSKSYASNGEKTIEITGRGALRMGYDNTTEHDWTDINRWGTLFVPTACVEMFRGCDNIGTISAADGTDFDLSNVTNMNGMFREATNFNGDISVFDTSTVTDMNNIFQDATSFNGDLSGWNVTSVTTYTDYDTGATAWQDEHKPFQPMILELTIPSSGEYGFFRVYPKSGETLVIDWDDGNVETMSNAADAWTPNPHTYAASGTYNIKITGAGWITTREGGGAPHTDAHRVTNVIQWGNLFVPSSLSNFLHSTSIGEVTATDISRFDTSDVTTMGGMFQNTNFNSDVSQLDTSTVTNMSSMFYGCTNFNQDISGWNTSSVTSMYGMFYNADAFNQDISSWNVSSVTNMNSMFRFADIFNQDLSGWTTGLTSQPSSFSTSATAWTNPLWRPYLNDGTTQINT